MFCNMTEAVPTTYIDVEGLSPWGSAHFSWIYPRMATARSWYRAQLTVNSCYIDLDIRNQLYSTLDASLDPGRDLDGSWKNAQC